MGKTIDQWRNKKRKWKMETANTKQNPLRFYDVFR